MAPCAENKPATTGEFEATTTSTMESRPPEKNIAFALNYELALVDQFLAQPRKQQRRVDDSTVSTPFTSPSATVPPHDEDVEDDDDDDERGNKQQQDTTNATTTPNNINNNNNSLLMTPGRRVSMRDKAKRTGTVARNRVRYDLQLVPAVQRNPLFLQQFSSSCWWLDNTAKEHNTLHASRRSARHSEPPLVSTQQPKQQPFVEDHSVIWIPSDRKEWEETVSELTSVCTQAAIRRHTGGVFVRPLSQEYIRDRIDIDDPLLGYQLRHKEGGWLQGFVMYTNFTTWNHGFRWDSLHPESGVQQQKTTTTTKRDTDGSIAIALEAEPRCGDVRAGGVVFPSIAEIGLLGGLGCGEYLLRMALEDIRDRAQYKFVVLQATDQSKKFYEKFGFVRVGAVCEYHTTALAGYRHWTHANESQLSLKKHGGPSYMMCLRLPTPAAQPSPSLFLSRMMELRVDRKPMILALGTANTPAPKVFKRIAAIENAALPLAASMRKKPVPKAAATEPARKRGRPPKLRPSSLTPTTATTTPARKKRVVVQAKRTLDVASSTTPRKRRKTTTTATTTSAYVEKQYNDIWLAVPPNRTPLSTTPKRKRGRPRKNALTPKSVSSKNGKVFHCIRGPDGKFVRVTGQEPLQQKPKQRKPTASKSSSRRRPPSPAPVDNSPLAFIPFFTPGKPKPLNATSLRKQKVLSHPRNKVYFFNRVVRLQQKDQYYFVLEFDPDTDQVCLVPMQARGVLAGKREGRPRYQCVVLENDRNFRIVSTDDCTIVRSAVVMKTAIVATEAWDVDTDGDVNFCTR